MLVNGDAKTIAGAFVKARGEMSATVSKDGTGNYGKYATLAAIVEASAAAFAKYGLAVIQETHLDDNGVTVDTWILHESGATMQFAPLTLPLQTRTPQAVGSATTYGRRYALSAICGLAADDDDGQAAEAAGTDSKPAVRMAVRPAQRPVATLKRQDASNAPSDDADVQFGRSTPSDATPVESAIIAKWQSRTEAEMWAVKVKNCRDEAHAKALMAAAITRNGGKVTHDNYQHVYLDFLRSTEAEAAGTPA